ncbi:hypothetical protein K8I85_19030 [bacterium]|nr:hypothetical protein [bacterium]
MRGPAAFAVLAGILVAAGCGRNSPDSVATDLTGPGGSTRPGNPPLTEEDSLHVQAVVDAQAIRDGAGIPPGETVGVRPGAAPGRRPDVLLKWSGPIVIRSREAAEAIASVGTGTEADPYVIAAWRIEPPPGAGADHGFHWDDPHGDYCIRLENVEIVGFGVSQVRVNTGGHLTMANVTLAGGGAEGAAGMWVGQGDVLAREVEFSGFEGDGLRTMSANACRVELVDCRWNQHLGKWKSGANGVQTRNTSGDGEIVLQNCEFVAPTLQRAILDWDDGVLTVRNCLITGGGDGYEARYRTFSRLTFLYNRLAVERAAFFADSLLSDWEIAYNDFDDSGDGYRLCRLDNSRDGTAHHNKFTKTKGSMIAANECLEGFDCENVVFEYNWVTECTEDAYEFVRPRGGCIVRHCVGDNVRGQIVDYFGNHPENGGEIHHIYGTCRDIGVILTDADNLYVHDIFTDNTASFGNYMNIRLEQRHTNPGEHPADCTIVSPLPRAQDSYLGIIFGTWGEVGPGNHAEWLENGELQTFDS